MQQISCTPNIEDGALRRRNLRGRKFFYWSTLIKTGWKVFRTSSYQLIFLKLSLTKGIWLQNHFGRSRSESIQNWHMLPNACFQRLPPVLNSYECFRSGDMCTTICEIGWCSIVLRSCSICTTTLNYVCLTRALISTLNICNNHLNSLLKAQSFAVILQNDSARVFFFNYCAVSYVIYVIFTPKT